jgi:hypothetical protein
VLPVRGGPLELRRVLLARLPGPQPEPVARVSTALFAASTQRGDANPGRGLEAAP